MASPRVPISQSLAIIGMACRLPGANGLDQFWKLIAGGGSAIAEVPPERLDQQLYYEAKRGVRGKTYSKLAALLPNRDLDLGRYPIPVDLAQSVDNTHLLMTAVAADAVRHAGLDPSALAPTNTAVFIGHAQGSSRLGELTFRAYLDDALALLRQTDFRQLPPHEQDAITRQLRHRLESRLPPRATRARHLYCNMVAGTIAKSFGLSGPWSALNSACASSLHAMLLGARALQLGRAEMAIVGGASDCKCDSLVLFSHAQALSDSGSRPFDADADGLIMSEGYVALVMKTLERALADGDPIQAVVRGLGVASDGRGKSLWAPRKQGQIKAIERAYRSGIDVSELQFVECHATGTQVGDATELETLAEVLSLHFPPGKRIPIGSVKANIGHALEAAGIAGVIKTVLCMQKGVIPPAINVRSLNGKIDWNTSPYYVPTQKGVWAAPSDGQPRRAAVSAFGIGGLNMHVVLDEFSASSPRLAPSNSGARRNFQDDGIAIVGIGCILPGAIGVENLWTTLTSGIDRKTSPPEGRWPQSGAAQLAGTVGGFVTNFEYDWRKHKVPPKQVAEADPLQFMLLEATQQALADAGYDSARLDRERCGVVIGTEFGGEFCDELEIGLRLPEMQRALVEALRNKGVSEDRVQAISLRFAEILLRKWPAVLDETGSFTSSTLASRITKTLDLAGGAVSIDSGSTSALSGLAICIDMLVAGDNDMMICAAGQRRMGPCAFNALANENLLASSGAKSLLDAGYDGIVPGEGVGVVVLKRLADARRDGDRIHAIIRGLGIAHAASPEMALRLAAERSCAAAGVSPADIAVAEVDTDEQLTAGGDELQSVAAVHGAMSRRQPLVVGSPTAQFGHLGGAAGILALLKAVLEIERGEIVPSVGVQQPSAALSTNALMQLATAPIKIAGRRLAAVACWSKGLACHVVLEHGSPQALQVEPAAPARTSLTPFLDVAASESLPTIYRFASATLDGLRAQLESARFEIGPPLTAARSFTEGDRHRLAIVADSGSSLERKVQLASAQFWKPSVGQLLEQQGVFYRELPARAPRVAFVFPGQGSQYEGMLRQLVRDVPAAASAMRRIDVVLTALGYPMFSELAWSGSPQLGGDIWKTQLSVLLADVIALAAVLDRGIAPDLVLGHSYGEFAAIYAAGAWDLETAIAATRARCEGIASAAGTGSGMLATNAPVELLERVARNISPELYLANLNAPDQTVVGGRREHLQLLARALEAQSCQARMLDVPAAFHTPLLSGARGPLATYLQRAAIGRPHVALYSTVTNAPVHDPNEIRQNLGQQLTTPVRYADLITQLAARQPTVFVEVGPQQVLTRLNQRLVSAGSAAIASDNARRPGLEALACAQALLECLGVVAGADRTAPVRLTPAVKAGASITPAASVVTSINEVEGRVSIYDGIPHFDATERRRTKMRAGASADIPAASSASVITAPPETPPISEPARPITTSTARSDKRPGTVGRIDDRLRAR